MADYVVSGTGEAQDGVYAPATGTACVANTAQSAGFGPVTGAPPPTPTLAAVTPPNAGPGQQILKVAAFCKATR